MSIPPSFRKFSIAVFLILTVIAPSVVWAEPASIAERLEALKAEREKLVTNNLRGAFQALREAVTSESQAATLYEKAIRAVQFGSSPQEGQRFNEWRRKNVDELNSKGFRQGVLAYLNYIEISLQHSAGAEINTIETRLLEHVQQIQENPEWYAEKDSLHRQDIPGSPLSRYLGADLILGNLKNWEMNPSNINGIFDKTLLPSWRERKDRRVIEYWTLRIEEEQARAEEEQVDLRQEDILNRDIPSLYWSRAEELVHLEQPREAVQEMLTILERYPHHQNFEEWSQRLLQLAETEPVNAE